MKRKLPERILLVIALLLSAPASSQQATEMIQRAGDDVARAEAAKRQFDATRTERADAWNANPSWSSREETASSQLAEAKLRLQVGKSQQDLIQLTQASAVAMQASQEYEQLVSDIRAWTSPVPEPEEPAPKPPSNDRPIKTDDPPDLTGRQGETTIVIPGNTPKPPAPRNPLSRPKTPPPDLYAAAGALFEGEYATSLRLLATTQFEDQRASAHAHLLRSAALFAMFYVEGEKDQSLLERAAEEVRLCREADPGLEPSARFFSPKYVEFFHQKTATE